MFSIQDKRDDHFYPNSSLESKPGAYRYKTRTKGLAPGLSKDHNPKYLNNNPPGRVGPPVLPKPSYYNPNSSSRVPQNIQIVEPVEDNYGSSQPSNYLSYINNNRYSVYNVLLFYVYERHLHIRIRLYTWDLNIKL